MLPVDVKPVFLPPSFPGRMNERTYARKTSVGRSVAVPDEKLGEVLTWRNELLQVRIVRRQTNIELLVDPASDYCQEDLVGPATEHVYRHESDQDLELLHIGPHDEGIATEEGEWQSKIDERQGSLDQVLQVETHANSPLSPCQMLGNSAKEAKFEHDRSLYVADKL
jgi:hypothetical protein